MTIRSFEAGDEAAQVAIYNEATADLPKYKPATLDEVRRRSRGPDFDPATRFYALADGRTVGYAGFHANGRVNYPWCRKGYERFAGPLLQRVLDAMRQRGHQRAFAAYRGDWPGPLAFFAQHGFRPAREMVNFVLDLVEMPTPSARPACGIGPLSPADLPAVLALGAGVLRLSETALEAYLFRNPYFPPEAVFGLRSRADGGLLAVGMLVTNPAYANPHQVDAAMPCFRLGAFGTEGMSVKRINGLFSFLAAEGRNVTAYGLDLLGSAAMRLHDTTVETFAAQVPSDAEHLVRFYKQHFRQQGSFPVLERELS
jgi:hypothetical protein